MQPIEAAIVGFARPCETAAGPALQTSVQWDTATGSYELNRVEVGLFGKRVWLTLEQPETDDDAGPVRGTTTATFFA
jgi:hypothetical protein